MDDNVLLQAIEQMMDKKLETVKTDMAKMMDKKLEPIANRLDKLDGDMKNLKADIKTIKEDTAITRTTVNELGKWAEKVEDVHRLGLYTD